ncbi:TonB-dependent siderophore receptor [Ancylobacter sp. Lp-2]|uniref:TonB-dependent receptor n=1 Tax=Ancylobacter sp. Lp-2 TaxID=2881339 RepID=UPI001E43175F|nr:TonB-dependent siderophore receptor [Ancylobacter sp. Lp-2]MCB4771033.1 TonB-dependent siderophore receptor [Ancylobacter sp. Lp-2]
MKIKSLRSLPHGALATSLAMTLSTVSLGHAQAQQQNNDDTSSEELPTVTVAGDTEPENNLQASTGLARIPGSVQDTPQTITVINQETMQQQGVTTLEQALRNVPGVTASIGEGNGGMNGDQFRIRGFEAKSDIFIGGLRDFGVYVRDSFAYESVEVFKGSSSENFGMGTTGGAININLKQAHLGDKYDFEGQFGTGPLSRGVIDLNKQINDTTAVRIVGMVNEQDVADRDHVQSDRWGLYGTVGFGIGTDQTLNLSYLHQDNNRTPDYGVMTVRQPGSSVRLPVTEYGVPRSNYYGKASDTDQSTVDMLTSNFSKEVNDWLTITNDTRFAYYTRTLSTSPANCSISTSITPSGDCSVPFFATGDAPYAFGAGGGSSYDQTTMGAQNVLTGLMKFETGSLRHEAVVGLDMFIQSDQRTTLSRDPNVAKVPGTILNPNFSTNYGLVSTLNGKKDTSLSDVAIFASDRVWFTEQWSVMGGIRWDNFSSDYGTFSTATNSWTTYDSKTSFASPKASVIWEPTKTQTYYVSYASSETPAGMYGANAPTPLNGNDVQPEENETYEIGAKLSLLDGRLGLTAALFRTDKANAYYVNPTTGQAVATNEEQRVQGLELGATGQITDKWTIQAAYTYMDSEVTYAANTALIGNPVAGVPQNAASVWMTYDIASLLKLEGELLVGGGITYRQEMYIRSDMTAMVPDSFSLDALLSYKVGKYRVALNGYNLTDELNYDAYFQGENALTSRAIPSSGRTVTFTIGATF